MLNQQQKHLLQNISSVYLQYEQFEKALPLLMLLMKLFPNDRYVYRQLAYLYYRQDRFDSAIKCCDRYQTLESQNKPNNPKKTAPWPFLIKSFCCLKLKQHQAAKDHYLRYTETRKLS